MSEERQRDQSRNADLIRFGERILFLGAHPDDIEIGCGGTAAKLADGGHQIAFAIASSERDKYRARIREEEAKQAAAVLGLSESDENLIFGRLPDRQLDQKTSELRDWLKGISQKFKPDTVFVHRFDDHTDHQAIYKVAIGVFHDKNIILFYIPRQQPETPFTPNHVQDISRYIEKKIAMCKCHTSQPRDYVSRVAIKTNAFKWYMSWFSRVASNQQGYAEAFTIYGSRSEVTPRNADDRQFEESETSVRREALCKLMDHWAHRPWLTHHKDDLENQIRRVLHPLDDLPPLFCRWALLQDHVHWVDFHYLLVTKQLMSLRICGPVHVLVDDTQPLINGALRSDQNRDSTSRTVAALLGQRARVHWLSAAMGHKAEYTELAGDQGFTQIAAASLEKRYIQETKASKLPGGRSGFGILKEWIQYMGWLAGDNNRCILLQWYRHAPTVEWSLSHFYELRSLVIQMPDLMLDGHLGKSRPPIKEPLVDPPQFNSILEWLESNPPLREVADLVGHLTIEQPTVSDVTEHVGSLLSKRGVLKSRLNAGDEFAGEAKKLIYLLASWNCTFFEGLSK